MSHSHFGNRDGSSQRPQQVETIRKTYSFGKRLASIPLTRAGVTTPAQMPILRDFWLAHGVPFKFCLSKADYDSSNSNFKIMVFTGAWMEEYQLGRNNVTLTLWEVA